MRYREPFTVFPRKLKSGRIVWYFQTYDEKGKRTAARSTGQTCRSAARAYCRKLEKEDALVPQPKCFITFEEYAEGWWTPGECEYLKYKMNRRELSIGYIKSSKNMLKNNILPFFGKYKLADISKLRVEEWLNDLIDRGISTSSANVFLGIFHIMMAEAVRREILDVDVTKKVQRLQNDCRPKGIFTQDLVTNLFRSDRRQATWDRDEYYYANLLAACTGMRCAEVLGLRFSDIKDGYVSVTKQYHQEIGTHKTKNKKPRIIPVPQNLLDEIKTIPHKSPDRFIFTRIDEPERPLGASMLRSSLYKALDVNGIDDDERKKQNLTFHSWRHYFNTVMRSNNVPDSKLQSMTGHSSVAMTDHYTHYGKEDLKVISSAQAKILSFHKSA